MENSLNKDEKWENSIDRKIKIAQDIIYVLNSHKASVSGFYAIYGWVKAFIESEYVNDIVINMKLPETYQKPDFMR